MSQNYPYDYDPNVFCSWIIEAPEEQAVVLNLLDFQVSEEIILLLYCNRIHIHIA